MNAKTLGAQSAPEQFPVLVYDLRMIDAAEISDLSAQIGGNGLRMRSDRLRANEAFAGRGWRMDDGGWRGFGPCRSFANCLCSGTVQNANRIDVNGELAID